MPPRIHASRSTEVLAYGLAGVGAFAPLCMLLPGSTERLASQTARWAPRWERNIKYFTPPIEQGIQWVTPPVERTVQRIGRRLQPSLRKAARSVDRNIKEGIAAISKR